MPARTLSLAKLATGLRTAGELAHVLGTDRHRLVLHAKRPKYHLFDLRKPDGSFRPIEDAVPELKAILRALNDLLQAVYWTVRTPAAYGYVRSPRGTRDVRSVATNARRHLHARWMVNVDLEDFFHQVHTARVETIFRQHPFRYPPPLARLLARLTTFQGRLPMGSPTSPALSNFAAMALDRDLMAWADGTGLVYTRFVDDLTFSCGQPGKMDRPLGPKHVALVEHHLAVHGFKVNPVKTRLYGPADSKLVTGLVVDAEVRAPDTLVASIEREVERIAAAERLWQLCGAHAAPAWLHRARQVTGGKVAFIGQALGRRHGTYTRLARQLARAADPPSDDEVRSWLDIPYGWDDAPGA